MTPTTTSFDPFDIVLVPFPFTDQRGTKKRPAIVVSRQEYHQDRPDLIIMAITSQFHHAAVGETVIRKWEAAGRLKPSVIKPVITTIEKNIVLRRLGHLQRSDAEALRTNLRRILNVE